METPLPRWNSWDLEPEPNVPTPVDLERAEQLKRQIQARLLDRSDRTPVPRAD